MEDFLSIGTGAFNPTNDRFTIAADPFAILDENAAKRQQDIDILDGIFGSASQKKRIDTVSFPDFYKSKQSPIVKEKTERPSSPIVSMDNLLDMMNNPNPEDISRLFSNISPKTSQSKQTSEWPFSNARTRGMMTRQIKNISDISPAAKQLISTFFRIHCSVASDIIIPECVEVLALKYLGHPAFAHCYVADENGNALKCSHKLFVVFGYHTLDGLIREHSQFCDGGKQADDTMTERTFGDSIVSDCFNETEYRIWRRDIEMPAPVYNGSFKELFECIDELIFVQSDRLHEKQSQFQDWDEFLGVKSTKKRKEEDDWRLMTSAYTLFLFEGTAEIEVMIERKEILQKWSREWKWCSATWAVGHRLKATHVLDSTQWK